MTISRRRWILASASPRRRDILRGLGLTFEVVPSSTPEAERRTGELPSRYAVRAARLKAEDVAVRRATGTIIGVDTIVVAGSSVMGKPGSSQDAARMLRSLSGRWHEVISGISLIDCNSRKSVSTFSCSHVHFRRLTMREISWYLDTGEFRDKAGAYAIQGHAALFIDRIEGCYFNIVGFPVAAFQKLCRKMGIDLFSRTPG